LLHFGKLISQAVDVVVQDRRQIRIRKRRFCPADELDQAFYIMRHRDLPEADFSRDPGDAFFMCGIPVTVNQTYRNR
jgi:hypothetical protein